MWPAYRLFVLWQILTAVRGEGLAHVGAPAYRLVGPLSTGELCVFPVRWDRVRTSVRKIPAFETSQSCDLCVCHTLYRASPCTG